jgi:ribose transport system permease protein
MNNKRNSILLLAGLFVVIYLVFYFLQPTRFGNLESMLILFQQCLIPTVSACGFYFILAMGLFDFSLGANIVFSAVVGAIFSETLGYFGLIVGCLLVGTLIGLANGIMYLKFRIPSIIATVGLLIVYECVAVLIGGNKNHILPENLLLLGKPPYNILIAVIAFGLAMFLISFTKIGVYIKAIGKNEPMAQSMGVDVSKYKVIGFTLCGLFAGITALMTISYSSNIIPIMGMTSMARNFQPIMGCFIGVAFKRYINPVISMLVGEMLIAMIINGIMTNGVDNTVQNMVIGMTLLLIVGMMSREKIGEVVK